MVMAGFYHWDVGYEIGKKPQEHTLRETSKTGMACDSVI